MTKKDLGYQDVSEIIEAQSPLDEKLTPHEYIALMMCLRLGVIAAKKAKLKDSPSKLVKKIYKQLLPGVTPKIREMLEQKGERLKGGDITEHFKTQKGLHLLTQGDGFVTIMRSLRLTDKHADELHLSDGPKAEIKALIKRLEPQLSPELKHLLDVDMSEPLQTSGEN